MSTKNYCTIFDKNYLLQALTLFRSLERHEKDFCLYCLCMDSESVILLETIASKSLVPIAFDALDQTEISKIKSRMTHGQLCWTSQPLICLHLLNVHHLDVITYLEADSMFFGSADPLYQELGNGSVTLVPHRYSRKYDQTLISGRFCVQFNLFRNDAASHEVLNYWKKECYRYDRNKPEFFPGQLCLDHWENKFKGVKAIEHLGAGVAPWNVNQYLLGRKDDLVTVNGMPTIFFHFHQFSRLYSQDYMLSLSYKLPKEAIEYYYKPYISELNETQNWINTFDPTFHYCKEIDVPIKSLKEIVKARIPKDVFFYLRSKYKGGPIIKSQSELY